MKKLLFSIVIVACIIFSGVASAESYNGYIVKVKSSGVSLMSVNDELAHVCDDLFLAEDMETIYDNIPQENIESVFPNYEVELFETDYPAVTSDTNFSSQWYLNTINAAAAREKGLTGNGVRVAVIDSGVNANHTDINGSNILDGYNCIVGATDKTDTNDVFGHGTMVTGLIAAQSDNENAIAGIASNVQIIPIKVTDTSTFDVANLIAGLKKAVDVDCDVINMSLGGAFTDEKVIAELKGYIDAISAKGVIMVAAVGNNGTSVLNYPAAFDNVIGVGAVDSNLSVWNKSQKNESVFVTAPGTSILTLHKNGSIASASGTSLATPIVTSTIALVKEVYPQATLQEIKTMLSTTAKHPNATQTLTYDVNYGYGVLDVAGIVELLENRLPEYVISKGVKNGLPRVHIHNNSLSTADLIYAAYDDYGISDLNKSKLLMGVTNISKSNVFDKVFLWNGLSPLIDSFALK